jgi:hypothetical protein
LGLDLGELHGVLGVFLFLELHCFRFLFHNAAFRRSLMVAEVTTEVILQSSAD